VFEKENTKIQEL